MAQLRWGPWRLDEERVVLELLGYGRSDAEYEVDLEDCKSSAQALDWIAQVAGKTWATPEIVGNLVFAMDELLNFQGNLCGFGKDQKFTKVAEHIKSQAESMRGAYENQPMKVMSAADLAEQEPTPDWFRAEYH